MLTMVKVYYICLILVLLLSYSFLYDAFFCKNIIRQKVSIKKAYKDLLSGFADKDTDETFKKAGINISIKKYVAYRNVIAFVLMVDAIYKLTLGISEAAVKETLLVAAFMILSEPKAELIKGKKSPFKMGIDLIYSKRQKALDSELVAVMSQMKSLIVTNNNNISADYIFTRLIQYCKISKGIFIQTHAFLLTGRREAAAKYFNESYDTQLGKKFSAILLKLDKLPASEFLKELEILQKMVSEEKKTALEKKRQTKTTLIFTLAGIQLAIIIFDYIYIVMADATGILSFM